MLKDKRFAVIVLVVFTALVLVMFGAKPAAGATETGAENNQTAIFVTPSVILNYSAVSGQEFAVNVNVTTTATIDLHGFTLSLSYDPNLIACVGIAKGDIFFAFNSAEFFPPANNTEGDVSASVNFTSPSVTVDDNGTLVTFTFQVKGTGETGLHIFNALLYGSSGTLQYTAYDGYFNNKINYDLTMPLTLLAVTLASLFLNQKTENKLKTVLEEREFRVRDAVLLVGLMAVMITLIVIVRQLSVILMVLFLFSYSLLLFVFGYLVSKNRWYIAVLPPAVFILLYVFLRGTYVWSYYLSNVYGLVFAVLITLYLAGLFDWTTTAVFGVLLTAMDIVLVLVTRTMVQAASAALSLSLPVLVSLPLFPLIRTGTGLLILSLGLGDFFFAGLLAVQTFKKYGKRLAIASVVGMTISFSLFEAFILTYSVGAFPGTLMIICGWAPVVLVQTLRDWRKTKGSSLEKVVVS